MQEIKKSTAAGKYLPAKRPHCIAPPNTYLRRRRRLISSQPPNESLSASLSLSHITHTASSEKKFEEMSAVRTVFLQCPSVSISPFATPSSSSNCVPVRLSASCSSVASPVTLVNENVDQKPSERNEVRLGLPSKGRMATDTLDLLKVCNLYDHVRTLYISILFLTRLFYVKDCQLSVRQVNPRQYVAEIPQVLCFFPYTSNENCI